MGVQSLIVCPTRELTLQTLQTLKRLVRQKENKKGNALRIAPLLGRFRPAMVDDLRKSPPDIAVGTPHLLSKLLQQGLLPLSPEPEARTIVLDEIGALVEDFRWPDVEKVLSGGDHTLRTSTGRVDPRKQHWLHRMSSRFVPDEQQAFSGNRLRGMGGQPPPRGRWAQGNVWMVSAYVPPKAVEKVVKAADTAKTGPRVTVLAPEHTMPASVRHVAVDNYSRGAAKSLSWVLASLLVRTDKNRYVGGNDRKLKAAEKEADALDDEGQKSWVEDEAWHGEGREEEEEEEEEEEGDGKATAPQEPYNPMVPVPTSLDQAAAEAAVLADGTLAPGWEYTSDGTPVPDSDVYGSARKVLVFVGSSYKAEKLKKSMLNRRIASKTIHNADGGEQADGSFHDHRGRSFGLREFESGKVRALIGTEMLAYGVDIKGASHVVNADIPASISSYVHRAGRVGRVGGTPGVVVSLPRSPGEMEKLRGYAEELGFYLEVVAQPKGAPVTQPKQAARRRMRRDVLADGAEEEGGRDDPSPGAGGEPTSHGHDVGAAAAAAPVRMTRRLAFSANC